MLPTEIGMHCSPPAPLAARGPLPLPLAAKPNFQDDMHMELGLYTFADVSPQPGPGAIGPHQRLRNLIEEIELADQVGLDVFGLGEHHRPDYAASAPVGGAGRGRRAHQRIS